MFNYYASVEGSSLPVHSVQKWVHRPPVFNIFGHPSGEVLGHEDSCGLSGLPLVIHNPRLSIAPSCSYYEFSCLWTLHTCASGCSRWQQRTLFMYEKTCYNFSESQNLVSSLDNNRTIIHRVFFKVEIWKNINKSMENKWKHKVHFFYFTSEYKLNFFFISTVGC